MNKELNRPVTTIIVGAGNRGLVYAEYAKLYPEKLKVVGVVDPLKDRRDYVAELFELSEDQCFTSVDELILHPKLADTVINGTMDHQHVPTSIPLLKKGYDILLEKPFAINEEEMTELINTVEKYDRKVMICHVLRYAPFYRAIKEKLLQGVIGEIINIQTTEHVSFHHMSTSFVRGKWGNENQCHTPMLLQKCCHDLDIIMWLQNGVSPQNISSYGSNFQFNKEKKHPKAGTRCMVDCPIEAECIYSAKKIFLENPERWSFYVWSCFEYGKKPTNEEKIASLKSDNVYGRCIWECDNNVVDHQSLIIEFNNGSTATHNMIGGTAKAQRSIHIIGTKGEIIGIFEDSKFIIRRINPSFGKDYDEEIVDLNIDGDKTGAFGGHGGGDLPLVEDFVNYVSGHEPSVSCTSIQASMYSHKAVFCAEKSRKKLQNVQVSFN
jgi:predicted dehydrogenase